MASDDGGAAELREKVARWVMVDQGYSGWPTEWMYKKADSILLLTSADARRRVMEAFVAGAHWANDDYDSIAVSEALRRYPEAVS